MSGALTEELCRVAGIFNTGVDEIDGYQFVAIEVEYLVTIIIKPVDKRHVGFAVLIDMTYSQTGCLGDQLYAVR